MVFVAIDGVHVWQEDVVVEQVLDRLVTEHTAVRTRNLNGNDKLHAVFVVVVWLVVLVGLVGWLGVKWLVV